VSALRGRCGGSRSSRAGRRPQGRARPSARGAPSSPIHRGEAKTPGAPRTGGRATVTRHWRVARDCGKRARGDASR
jgi:hypothetical protein